MKRDVLFLGMDIHKEIKKLIDEFYDITVEKMTEEQKSLYYQGIEDTLSCVIWLLHRDKLDDATYLVHIEDLDQQEEFYKRDLFKLADKRGYSLPEYM